MPNLYSLIKWECYQQKLCHRRSLIVGRDFWRCARNVSHTAARRVVRGDVGLGWVVSGVCESDLRGAWGRLQLRGGNSLNQVVLEICISQFSVPFDALAELLIIYDQGN